MNLLRARADEEIARRRRALDDELADRREEIARAREEIVRREAELGVRAASQAEREGRLAAREAAMDAREGTLAARERALDTALEQASGLGREEAVERLLARLEKDLEAEQSERVARAVARADAQARARAQEILAAAIQRVASDLAGDATITVVDVPSEQLKPRLVGRDGRNLRTFEEAAGVDLIVDDTPGAVVLASFDPVRREAARIALEKLFADGRIHPARIEAVLAEARKEVDDLALEAGRAAALEADVGPLSDPLVAHLGRLHFRQVRGQNVLRHALEVAALAGALAAEIGLDPRLARRCGLLHDLGRAVDAVDADDAGHAAAGADLARRAGEPREVVNAIAAHKDDVPAETPYALLTRAADLVSIERPGARDDLATRFVRRMKDLEEVARSFAGVERAFALAAGRDLRVLVDAEKVNDKLAAKLARDIAKKIEETLSYPGEVRVTLVREARVTEYAK
jgi:ribonuclease Y